MSVLTDSAPPPPKDWVPADRRWLGFDTRTKWPALVTVGIAILFIVVIPLLTSLKNWDNPVRAGDVVRLSPNLTMTPPVGWNLAGGLRTSEGPASEAKGAPVTIAGPGSATSFQVIDKIGASTSKDLLERAARAKNLVLRVDKYTLNGSAGTIRTQSGITGVRRSFITPNGSGEIAAFRVPGTDQGLVVQVDSAGGLTNDQQAIDSMIDSIEVSS